MSFKVGDRVEVLTPADGASYSSNNVGEGTVLSIEHGNYKVKVDSNAKAWFYRENQLRPLGTTEATPKPSIKVGDQVRLTGVVWLTDDSGAWVDFPGTDHPQRVKAAFENLEVIRQPFKRGEVVYPKARPDTEWMIVADEQDGQALAVVAEEGWKVVKLKTQGYERRP